MPDLPRTYADDATAADLVMTAVAWPVIFGGTLVILVISLILTPLGAAFDMVWLSSWHHTATPAATITTAGVVWLMIVQWISAGLGGYLTGRLRTKWIGAHTHEVFFRDTVHGFLAWALATVIGAALLLAVSTHAAAGGGLMESSGITATGSLLYSLSLFLGAFIACVAGALGGAHRDLHYTTGRLTE